MKRLSIIGILTAVAFLVFAAPTLDKFDVTKFNGEYMIISLKTLLETPNYVSVEGVVYAFEHPKKFLTRQEVDPSKLTDDNFVGILGITIDELKKYNGKDGPAMVAVNGIVYDVSWSRLWKDGTHANRHNAGEELTHDIVKLSPHGVKKLEGFKPFGILVFTPQQLQKYNGKGGAKSYAAVLGVVYDMSQSQTVKDGVHYAYPMGNELTYEISQRPGHVELLKRSHIYPIGLLVFDEENLSIYDGTKVKAIVRAGELFKSFIMVGNKVYDVTQVADWRNRLNLDSAAPAGKDYTTQFECELGPSCGHDHPDVEVLKDIPVVGYRIW
ncbi:cytochrome b5-like heme/steroid binding domain-containing protein [Pseudothermotoga thermarum]|uniref:Cytochrome b5 n=1 Tax=Pseudothermotoga thermarum DSM 5069 TaxID=688269 RepID=F7YUT7_9THEM|nr:cytochrome b5 domain-containing protein [Pseudothermotoga thermarum]AEH51497.1 cytochrome b5 [Pseudothermotoga thermarum DSM 5069]